MIDQKSTLQQPQKELTTIDLFIEYKTFIRHIYGDLNKKLLDLMRNYINQYYEKSRVELIGEDFFDCFYNLYLPQQLLRLRPVDIKKIFKEWISFADYVNNRVKGDYKSHAIKAYKTHEQELFRIMYLFKEMRRLGEVPVLSWEPLIIDMKCYRNMKRKEDSLNKYMVFEQGFFKVQDKIGTWVIFYKEAPIKTYYKIKIDVSIAEEIKNGDIVHMSIKRKVFCTSWDIINVKAYFNENAGIFLNQGGKSNERK